MSMTPDVQVQNLQISEIVILRRSQKKKKTYTHTHAIGDSNMQRKETSFVARRTFV